jgi:eukaryotic-like serine/threonine-protein kinase
MGQVLLAQDPVLDRPVAVKHLRDDLALAHDQLVSLTRRMEQEARASARVSHPNLVALHDMGQDPGVGLYLVFEYVEGPTLKERLERGPLNVVEAARLSRQLGGALTLAHAASVLHRDVKPENVILARTGAKIADFGIARLPDSTLTRPGGLLGTPAYSAPEAIDQGSFSAQSDQFSMACTLFEAISAQRAFPGDDAVAVAALVQTSEPPGLAHVFRLDARVDTVLARAFAKHPASRFPSCEEFGNALGEALETHSRATMITQPDGHHRALSVAPLPELRPRGLRRLASGSLPFALVLLVAALLGYRTGTGIASNGERPEAALPLETREPSQAAGGLDEAELNPVAWLPARPASAAIAKNKAARVARARRARTGAAQHVDAGTGALP